VILLNIDVGEVAGEPDELYAIANVVNVACGGHAGDDASMNRALSLCKRFGTRAGAHPSYPDREGFGRRARSASEGEARAFVRDQCARLAELGRSASIPIHYAKPHGALYHAANTDLALARGVMQGVVDALGSDVALIGPPEGLLREVADAASVRFVREAFADRGVRKDGSLIPRGEPGDLIVDPVSAAARARAIATSGGIDTVCVHGDTPGAVAIARAVRGALA
jgi:UPF0271 protein